MGGLSASLHPADGLSAHLDALDARVSVQRLDRDAVADALRVFALPFIGPAAGPAAGLLTPTPGSTLAPLASPPPDLDELQAQWPVQATLGLDEGLEVLDGEVGPILAWSPQPGSAGLASHLAVETDAVPDPDGIGRAEGVRLLQDAHAMPSTGITLRLDDVLGHWEVDMIRRDQLLDLVVRGDAGLKEVVLASAPELRERLSQEGLVLNRVAFSNSRSEADSRAQHQDSRDSNGQHPPTPRRPTASPQASLPTTPAPQAHGTLNRVV